MQLTFQIKLKKPHNNINDPKHHMHYLSVMFYLGVRYNFDVFKFKMVINCRQVLTGMHKIYQNRNKLTEHFVHN